MPNPAQQPQWTPPASSNSISVEWLHSKLAEIEESAGMDALTIYGQIVNSLELRVREAVEMRQRRREGLLVIIDTPGGIVEVTERIANVLRHHYVKVHFLVPDKAMSAGTVLVMSGDAILMDYFSCLGPVDPQLYREGSAIPVSVMSYLEQYERFVKKAEAGMLTAADAIMLEKLDPGEMRQYELAIQLSTELIREWLVRYKFKDWNGARAADGRLRRKTRKTARAKSRMNSPNKIGGGRTGAELTATPWPLWACESINWKIGPN